MKQRVTLYIDGQLWRDFRADCVQRGKSASEIVDYLINDHMLQRSVERGKEDARAGRVVTHEEMMTQLGTVIEGDPPVS